MQTINRKAIDWKTGTEIHQILSPAEKDIFAGLIGIQYLRLPNIRNKYLSWEEKREVALFEIQKSFFVSQFPEHKEFLNSITIEYDNDYSPIVHLNILNNPNIVDAIQDCILDKIWLFYISSNDDFYTSDNPILIKPHLENQTARWEGFGMNGGEIIFPVGSSVLLSLLDKDLFKHRWSSDNKFCYVDDKQKREYNSYQYIWANEEVYSKRPDFRLIELLKDINNGDEIFMKKPTILVNGK